MQVTNAILTNAYFLAEALRLRDMEAFQTFGRKIAVVVLDTKAESPEDLTRRVMKETNQ